MERCLADGGSDESCAPKAIRQANGTVGKSAGDPDSALYYALLKQDAVQRYTLGVVYEPMEIDSQGDFASEATIRDAQRKFMRLLQAAQTGDQLLTKWSGTLLDAIVNSMWSGEPIRLDVTDLPTDIAKARYALGDQHSSWNREDGEIVECYCMPCDVVLDGQPVKKGAWMLGAIWSPPYFEKILRGERTGYSMGGTSRWRWVEALIEEASDAA